MKMRLLDTSFRVAIVVLIMLGAASGLFVSLQLLASQLRRLRLSLSLSWYDIGWFGYAPVQAFFSFDYPAPAVEVLRQDSRCSNDYTFIAPRGPAVDLPGAVILDADGNLIWRQMEFLDGDTQDFKVQEYQGEKFLTYWVGKEKNGKKEGSWFMLDETYTLRHEVTPSGGLVGDMHEFQITSEGTALISIYESRQANLSLVGGPEQGWILDSIFQEIDIESGVIIFRWSAYEHVPLESTWMTLESCSDDETKAYDGCGNHEESAFDYFHLNSIDKDDAGGYLISARHLHSLIYIDGRTGSVVWTLGGKQNEFADLSGSTVTRFSWQHHARWQGNRTISLFDNAAHAYSDSNRESRALFIRINEQQRTAELVHEFNHPGHIISTSQGSTQLLDNGNVLVGWGHSAVFSEFLFNGELLCDAHFGAEAFESFGLVTSYRIFKDTWVGKPNTPIDVAMLVECLYVSWNGATEVHEWQLEACMDNTDLQSWEVIIRVRNTGFETEIGLGLAHRYDWIRVVAMDAEGNVLGTSVEREVPEHASMLARLTSPLAVFISLSVISCISVIATCLVVKWSCIRVVRRGANTQYRLVPTYSDETASREEIVTLELGPFR